MTQRATLLSVTSFKRRLRRIVLDSDTEPWEFFVGLFTITWSTWFTLPSTTSAVPFFEESPKWVLGVPLLLVGIWKLYALAEGSLIHRIVAGVTMSASWSSFSAVYIYSNWNGQPTSVYPFFALASVWTAFRLNRRRFLG